MLYAFSIYYAQNYAGIIGQGLFTIQFKWGSGGFRGGVELAHATPLNCTHPHGNDCLMAKKQVELLPVLARKVFIYT